MFPGLAKSVCVLLKAAGACGVAAIWLTSHATAQPRVPEQGILRLESRSQQFLVFGAPPGSALGPPSLSLIETNHLQMEPTLLVLTCERVKTELLHELGLPDVWAGRIQINVQGALRPTEPVVVESQWYPGGWRYQIVMPGQLERTRLMRTLTRALLLEIANRNNPSQRLAEIPLWLEAGLATHLLALHGDTLVPEIRTLTSVVQAAHPDVFLEARRQLTERELVSFADLCQAQPHQFNDEQWETFRRTAQLLVAELLYLPDGRAGMQAFLRELPNYLNSQLALQRGFAAHFSTVLDAEKWWAVVWMNFTARDRHMRFSQAKGLRQLEEILASPIAVRLGTNAVPSRKELPLREVIALTEFAQHQPAVAQANLQLQLLQVTAPVELARLISDYRQALLTYQKRRTEYSAKTNTKSADAKLATKDVLERLDLLEVIRLDLSRLDTAAAISEAR
ncbi:MAG: hypothetical protein RL514_3752 [Verrucomicrobiota bacterium]|jgi:hypothetical protein